ncbi:hypothetical protein [Companilactobacillus furfuricola]|uniref:hypothetical protein n=1 Tax=Companilactobacillus furfuricola TaxID=1462575 RepID=UPI0013DE4224|nr:hypothetical protein [Companilactobacillus furfuricola]
MQCSEFEAQEIWKQTSTNAKATYRNKNKYRTPHTKNYASGNLGSAEGGENSTVSHEIPLSDEGA